MRWEHVYGGGVHQRLKGAVKAQPLELHPGPATLRHDTSWLCSQTWSRSCCAFAPKNWSTCKADDIDKQVAVRVSSPMPDGDTRGRCRGTGRGRCHRQPVLEPPAVHAGLGTQASMHAWLHARKLCPCTQHACTMLVNRWQGGQGGEAAPQAASPSPLPASPFPPPSFPPPPRRCLPCGRAYRWQR